MSLHQIGLKYGTDKATYHGYLDFYQGHLPPRDKKINLLEIGVKDGASLKMWREYYFKARIVGVDIAISRSIGGCDIYRLDATDLFDLSRFRLSSFDVIIDDGSHMTIDQQRTFSFFKNIMRSGDIYIVEDTHTSHWPQYITSEHSTEWYVRSLVPDWEILKYHNENNPGDSETLLIKKP